ncbi:MAG: NAD-dependent succinate-semialdehyde dehydrogenase [Rhodospirillaceae bacterium]|nr:NAD-dependent succinate-semialdehyde dehydrogenase [Rhodospirillaceae bacterium]|tara:strand:+ start:3980 stop:5407 length:1428 start_codon:yes stop_codon:yes gene_type:complete
MKTELFIGGNWVSASDGETFPVEDPATEQTIAHVASASVDDVTKAVDVAHEQGIEWARRKPRERAEVLRCAWEMLSSRREKIAELIVRENGKALNDAYGETDYAIEFFRWYSEEAVRNYGEILDSPLGNNRIVVVNQPIGVSVLVTPWNYPAAMATRKIAPALAAGCPVILKPASDTPLTALFVAEILTEAGVPSGVMNVVPSRRSSEVVSALLHNPLVRKLSFTGSTEVGRALLREASDCIVDCSMELGGNAPFLVFDDADIDAAVSGAMIAKMRNGGEACTAANRFYAHENIYEEFTEKFSAAMAAMKVGPGLESGVELGPMVNAWAIKDIDRLVEDAKSKGSDVITGGAPLDRTGHFYPPTVLAGVPNEADILTEEVFGPVAPVVAFSDEDEVINAANNTEYGLVSYLYTGNLERGMAISERLDAGMIGLNRGLVSDPAAPFGGTKQSGLGREGSHEGMMEYMEKKYIAVEW